MPYRLATAQDRGMVCKEKSELKGLNSLSFLNGVGDGTRTHDNRNHNPGLYQLSYTHHQIFVPVSLGLPGRIRTSDPRLRRPMLYPTELRAEMLLSSKWSG